MARDVGVEAQVRDMAGVAAKRFGDIDVLIDHAQALFTDHAAIEECPAERRDRPYQTGIKAICSCCKAVLPHVKARGGKVINFGSGRGVKGAPGWCDYPGNKAASRAFSKTAAREWSPYNIQVNLINPAILTPSFLEFTAKHPEMEEARRRAGAQLGDPERGAGAAAPWLASADGASLTGHTVRVGPGGIQQMSLT